jgi:hypothetical protein
LLAAVSDPPLRRSSSAYRSSAVAHSSWPVILQTGILAPTLLPLIQSSLSQDFKPLPLNLESTTTQNLAATLLSKNDGTIYTASATDTDHNPAPDSQSLLKSEVSS